MRSARAAFDDLNKALTVRFAEAIRKDAQAHSGVDDVTDAFAELVRFTHRKMLPSAALYSQCVQEHVIAVGGH
jgi:hypothetical protein